MLHISLAVGLGVCNPIFGCCAEWMATVLLESKEAIMVFRRRRHHFYCPFQLICGIGRVTLLSQFVATIATTIHHRQCPSDDTYYVLLQYSTSPPDSRANGYLPSTPNKVNDSCFSPPSIYILFSYRHSFIVVYSLRYTSPRRILTSAIYF